MSTYFNRFTLLMQSIIVCVCLSMTACLIADSPKVNDIKNAETDAADFIKTWKLIDAIVDQLMAEHISPPTRQQMILSSCRGLFVATRKLPPRSLSESFSKCVTEKDLQHLFQTHWNEQITISQLKPEQLQQFAINGLLNNCEPGIAYINSENSRVQQQLSENQYVGIGIQLIRSDDGWPSITKPFYGGAAQKAGARAGDFIVAINGESTQNRDFGDVVDDLRGPKGTQLVVSLRHESETEIREKTMIRDVVPIASIVGRQQNQDDGSWAIAMESAPDIAHLKIETVVGSTASEMMKFARQIETGDFKGVILDFRDQRGRTAPQLHHAIMLVDSLVRDQKIGHIITNEGLTEIIAQDDALLKDMPISVLCDEVVSGPLFLVLSALQNSGKAKIVGRNIRSNGLCTTSVEIGNQMGALEGVSYAVALPYKSRTDRANGFSHEGESQVAELGRPSPRFLLTPAVQFDPRDPGLLEAAVKVIRH